MDGFGGIRDVSAEITAEINSLDANFPHASRLLKEELERHQKEQSEKMMDRSGIVKLTEKIYFSGKYEGAPKHNVVGRLLGPQGTTIKRIQAETQCKISILGTGSMRDKRKEDELRNGGDAKYEHLRDQLHVLVEAQGPYDVAQARRAAGVAEIRKMLLPPVPGMDDPLENKYGGPPPPPSHRHDYPPPRPSPRPPRRGPPPPSRSHHSEGRNSSFSDMPSSGGSGGGSLYSSFSDFGPGSGGYGGPSPGGYGERHSPGGYGDRMSSGSFGDRPSSPPGGFGGPSPSAGGYGGGPSVGYGSGPRRGGRGGGRGRGPGGPPPRYAPY